MIILLYILLYIVIGFIVGRITYRIFPEYDDERDVFSTVIGIFWIIFIPFGILIFAGYYIACKAFPIVDILYDYILTKIENKNDENRKSNSAP